MLQLYCLQLCSLLLEYMRATDPGTVLDALSELVGVKIHETDLKR